MRYFLHRFWQGWQRVARRLAEWQGRIILTGLYIVLMGLLTLVARAKDPLGLRGSSAWHPYRGRSTDLSATRSQ